MRTGKKTGRDNLGDRMKMYEGRETSRVLMPRLPICIRIDGRSFSRWTRDLKRPYDPVLSDIMVETTRFLMEESSAVIGYTQSDEISLILHNPQTCSESFFNGKVQKLTSVLASAATVKFAELVREHLPHKSKQLAMFDCRVWSVPTLEEAANCLLWRELDATRNSIQSAAGSVYSHNVLHKKNTSEMQELLFQKGINWNDYPSFFKRGTYLRKRKIRRLLTEEERSAIPEAHRPPPEQEVERTEVARLELPPLRSIQNRVETLFFGEEPTSFTPSSSPEAA